MKNPVPNWIAAAALLTLAAFGAPAQSEEKDALFRAETRLVVLHTTVMDKDNRLITDLPRDAFEVYEDDERQEIEIFRQEDVPVSIGILVDNSGSMRDKRQQVNAAALDFVKASNPEDEVFIVNFNDEAYLDTPFTGKIERMQDGLQRIDSRGGTALYDAISMSLDHLVKYAERDKRVLLVVSDGEDNASQHITLEELVRKLQESETVVYSVGLLTEEEPRAAKRAERALKHIVEATGGAAFFPKSVNQVHAIAQRIAADIRNQYILAYSPDPEKGPGYRRIKIDLTGAGRKLEVRHRPGYYAE